MTKVKAENALSLQEKHAAISELAQHLRELRKAVSTRMQKEGLNVGNLASRLGLRWNEINRFVHGNRAIGKGKILQILSEYSGLPNVQEKVLALDDKLGSSSRLIGVAAFSGDIIDLVFTLQEKCSASDLTCEMFAKVFGNRAAEIEGVLHWKAEDIAKLEGELGAEITDLLTSLEFERRLDDVKARYQSEFDAAVKEMDLLVAELRPKYANVVELTQALGVSRSMIYEPHCKNKNIRIETMRSICAKARALLGKTPGEMLPEFDSDNIGDVVGEMTEDRVRGEPREEVPHKRSPSPTRRMLRDNAGETLADGTRFVLTTESFKLLDFDPGPRGVLFTKRQIAVTRALLNMFCQIKNPRIREIIRKRLSGEIEELELAIRQFSEEFPNELLAVHQAARQTMRRFPLEGLKDGKKKGL